MQKDILNIRSAKLQIRFYLKKKQTKNNNNNNNKKNQNQVFTTKMGLKLYF